MAYPKITVNTGQALIVVPSDTIPIPNPNFIAATGVGNQVDNGINTSVVTNKLVDTGATWTATTPPLPVVVGVTIGATGLASLRAVGSGGGGPAGGGGCGALDCAPMGSGWSAVLPGSSSSEDGA